MSFWQDPFKREKSMNIFTLKQRNETDLKSMCIKQVEMLKQMLNDSDSKILESWNFVNTSLEKFSPKWSSKLKKRK